MRTTSKPQPNHVHATPTRETLYYLMDEMTIADYSGKRCISTTEIKHIHLNYALVNLSIINN